MVAIITKLSHSINKQRASIINFKIDYYHYYHYNSLIRTILEGRIEGIDNRKND